MDGTGGSVVSEGGQGMDVLKDSATKTYRYLRIGVIGMIFALAVALVIEITTDEEEGILGSISAYYYTPVAGIFVGVLVAAGFSLIMIKGRPGAEDIMLNLAGMLAPVVALVPTPISEPVYGLDPAKRSVPSELVPTVENNVATLLILGLAGLVAAFLWIPTNGPGRRVALRGLAAGAGLWLVAGSWFVFWRQAFLDKGHYFAAVSMFLLLVVVAFVNAVKAPEREVSEVKGQLEHGGVRGLTPPQYRLVYGAIAGGMGLVLLVAVVMFGGQEWLDWGLPTGWLFVVEALLLLLFCGFWLAQTSENWDLGSPVADSPRPQPAATSQDQVEPENGTLPPRATRRGTR